MHGFAPFLRGLRLWTIRECSGAAAVTGLSRGANNACECHDSKSLSSGSIDFMGTATARRGRRSRELHSAYRVMPSHLRLDFYACVIAECTKTVKESASLSGPTLLPPIRGTASEERDRLRSLPLANSGLSILILLVSDRCGGIAKTAKIRG